MSNFHLSYENELKSNRSSDEKFVPMFIAIYIACFLIDRSENKYYSVEFELTPGGWRDVWLRSRPRSIGPGRKCRANQNLDFSFKLGMEEP